MKFWIVSCVSLCWAVQAAEPAVKLGFDSEAALLRDDGASQTAFRTQGTLLFDENGVKGGCDSVSVDSEAKGERRSN